MERKFMAMLKEQLEKQIKFWCWRLIIAVELAEFDWLIFDWFSSELVLYLFKSLYKIM
jgi:hypothetical protein